MNRGNSERFNSDWWNMTKIDYAREKLLNKEHREVTHEIIYQECWEGVKTIRQISEEHGIHKSTTLRIKNGKGLNKNAIKGSEK